MQPFHTWTTQWKKFHLRNLLQCQVVNMKKRGRGATKFSLLILVNLLFTHQKSLLQVTNKNFSKIIFYVKTSQQKFLGASLNYYHVLVSLWLSTLITSRQTEREQMLWHPHRDLKLLALPSPPSSKHTNTEMISKGSGGLPASLDKCC